MRALLFALSVLTVVLPASADELDEEELFDAEEIMQAFKDEAVGCGGIDVDGSRLDELVQDRRCAMMNAWGLMLESHGYCFEESTQEWAVCSQ